MCFIPIVQIIINKVQPTTAAAAAVGSKRNYIPNCLLKDVHTKSIDGSPENKNPKMTFQLLGISTMSCSLKNSANLSNYFILLSYQTVSKNRYNWYVLMFAIVIDKYENCICNSELRVRKFIYNSTIFSYFTSYQGLVIYKFWKCSNSMKIHDFFNNFTWELRHKSRFYHKFLS